jgi:sarcosine oxidase subunit beta
MRCTADVVIVGAGIAGASIAFHLASLGIRDVLVIEKEPSPGQGSTSKANGGIRAQFSTAINIQMSLYSISAFERFHDDTGGDCGLRQAGYLFMTATEFGESYLRENFRLQQKLGVPSRWLSREDIAELAPYARNDDLHGGTFSPEDGFLDPHGSTHGYMQAARRLGVELAADTEVTAIVRDTKGVCGVETGSGRIATKCVIDAAGPFAGIVAQRAGVDIPLRPVKRMLACTEEIGGAPPLIPMTIDLDTGLLIRREGRGILFAYSNPDDKPGFDTTFDAGFIEVVSEKAMVRFPFLEEARIALPRCWAGLYPETPDHHAILGKVPELPGFYLAAGFGGHGLMHAPATGRALAELVAFDSCRFMDISPLRLERFREGELILETAVL